MDKNRIEGLAKEAKGSVTEAIGKLTGNDQAEAQGAAEKVQGKVQAAAGKATDTVKDTVKK